MKKKVNSPLYLSSVENILEKALLEILKSLKNSYEQEKESICYVTICQKTLVNPIRSGTYHLQENSLNGLVNHIMTSFNRFLNSNKELKLDDSFEIYFKVLSSESINYEKHRRKTVPLRNLVGSKNGSKTFLAGGLLDLPTTFPNNKTCLENMCLLSTVIYSYIKFSDEEKFKKINKMCYSHSAKSDKNLAGQLLEEEIDKFCSATNIPKIGPHDFTNVLPKLADFYNLQIHLVQSLDGLRKVSKISVPETNDLNRHRVYLYQTEINHVMLIDNLNQFFIYNKRKICFDCGNFYQYLFRTNVHRCFARSNCDKCLGCFETLNTVKVNKEPTVFCDSKLKIEGGVTCIKCHFSFKTNKCFQNHKQGCDLHRLRVKCEKCNVYYLPKSKKSFEEGKSNHECGIWLTRCSNCKQINNDDFHICKVRTEEAHNIWPNLGFINMQFQENSFGNCQTCFLLKEKFMKENNLSFKQLFVHKNFENLICDDHKSISDKDNLPNLISLWFESKQRFHFEQKVFVDNSDLLKFAQKDSVDVPYCDSPLLMTPEVYKEKPSIKTMSQTFYKYLNKVSSKNTALDQFFLFLCDRENAFSNYTYIVENNNVMMTLLRYFLELQVVPSILQNQNTITLLAVSGLRIKFLLRSSYIKGTAFEVALQYGVKFQKTFFPNLWNKAENYNYVGKKPQFKHYLLFTDSEKDIVEKQLFYDQLPDEWNFNEQLMSSFQNETLVSLKAVIKFIQQSFALQKTLAKVTGKVENAIHPFNGKLMSLSGFSYSLFHFYFLNNVESFSVVNENNFRTQSSRPEFEWIGWLNYNNHNSIQSAFNSPSGQKYFGKYSVDGYDAKTKTVYQFQG